MANKIKVLFLASEADPFIRIGGLGDVAGALPPALSALGGIDIRLCLPLHSAIPRGAYDLKSVASFDIKHATGANQAEAFTTEINGLTVYLISGSPIVADAPVYSSDTLVDGDKFTFFSLAALELVRHLNWTPDLIHANDWHTAPAIYALDRKIYPSLINAVTLLGLHNLPYLGVGAGPALQAYGLEPAYESGLPSWAQDAPLPLGLLSADHIVAVSPNYAREILTPEFGSGLHEFLQTRSQDISGILNGIDVQKWNPQSDPDIDLNYCSDTLQDRSRNKLSLLEEYRLSLDRDTPLLAMVGRLDPQKGVDLIPEALHQLTHLPWQMIILGTGVPAIEEEVRRLEVEFPDRLRAAIRFDAVLSHKIYASADAILIPSRYEPCGLVQMISMRYGCVPVARSTGGLRDTIKDSDRSVNGTGFLFKNATTNELAGAVSRAIRTFHNPDKWQKLQIEGMRQDFSWQRSARQYMKLYKKFISQRRQVATN